MDATDFKEYRIKVFDEGDGQNLKSIIKINEEVDDFIKVLHKEKIKNVKKGKFIAWDPQKKFDPEQHIKRGYIDVGDNVVFLTHRDAMRCFGYQKVIINALFGVFPTMKEKYGFQTLSK